MAPASSSLVVPDAPRPSWLARNGVGQKNVAPLKWALTIKQWTRFVDACQATTTWARLASQKDDACKINMYDVRDHFINPWTRGTGSSIALLMNPVPQVVSLMISHAWAGSVLETKGALASCNEKGVPPDTLIFFCTFCMYQPEDGASNGLSISEQLAKDPFACIIESRPAYGMRIVHTSQYEVYERLWTVYEVDAGISAGVELTGLFDYKRFRYSELKTAMQIDTRTADCRAEDKEMLEDKIVRNGGFDRLNTVIRQFRQQMFDDYKKQRNKVFGKLRQGVCDQEKQRIGEKRVRTSPRNPCLRCWDCLRLLPTARLERNCDGNWHLAFQKKEKRNVAAAPVRIDIDDDFDLNAFFRKKERQVPN